MTTVTPYERHKAAGHSETRCSRDGIRTIVECETCNLAWLMPIHDDEVPVTLYHWFDLWGQRRKA